jgi:SSS family solute:Na+ symporter
MMMGEILLEIRKTKEFKENTMNKFIKIIWVAMLTLPGFASAAETAEGFFEFSEAPAAHSAMLQQDSGKDVLVFEGLVVDDGLYRISGQTVTRGVGDETAALPDLPMALENPGAALAGGNLFVAGGTTLLKLNLNAPEAGWGECAALPEAVGEQPALVGSHGVLHLVGTAAFAYHSARDEWTRLSEPSEALNGFIATACGNDHLLFFNANQPDDRIIAYHRVTDTWFGMGHLPSTILPLGAASDGTEFTVWSKNATVSGTALLKPTKYGWVDHSVVAILVLLLVGVGIYFSKKEKSSGDYFRGGNRIPWWAAGLSLFATGASAISLMAMPGKAFAENWIYFSISIFIVMIQLPLLLLVYIPIARRLEISTANEYLERRFSLPVRMLGFICFSLNQMLGRMAAILLLPALAISAIFGMPMEYSILIMGVVTTLFVTMGGLEAVIWTDVLQAIIMLLAVLVCAFYAFFSLDIGAPAAMEILGNLEKLKMFDFSLNWKEPVFIVLVLNTFATVLGMIGDQNFIQRVQCTPDEKESRKAVYTQLAVAVPMNLVLFALGTLLFLFYTTRADTLSPALKADGVFPFFAAQNLPPGLAGFVVVALLAATISTVSSAMNSVANLGVEDVYRRFFPKVTDHKCLVFGRILTLALGIFGTGAALLLANISNLKSIWDLFIMIFGMVLAPITGIFVLGIFTRRANNVGIWVGTVASVCANYYAKFHLDVHATVYLVVGVFTCIVVGYLASFLAPKSDKDLEGLTVYTLLKK